MAAILPPDPEALRKAAALLSEGQLVSFPTETVYGLGADARDDRAVARIFEAKGRPDFNPLIVHVADIWAAEALIDLPEAGRKIAGAFWPGPLTLVLPRRDERLARAGCWASQSRSTSGSNL